jgi:hypothetical protein
MITFD